MTDRENMPPLPEPLLETNGDVFGHENVQGYTADQLRAYGQACWNAAIEAAAKKCEQARDKALAAQHGSPDELQNVMLRQVAHVGAGECASAIRSMKEPE